MLAIPYVYMAKIIWIGNMTWSDVEDGNQPWDKEIETKNIPDKSDLAVYGRIQDFDIQNKDRVAR